MPTDNHSYTYNPLEQLKTTDTTLYGYDGSGNLTTTLAGATQYYDKANEVTASVASPGITLVGSSTAAGATGTTLTVNYPAGTKSGDWLILAATMAYPNTLTVPSGWTQVVKKSSGSVSGTSDTTYVLRHKASTETSVTITFSGTFARAVAVGAYRGVAASSPVDVSGSASTNGGTTVTTPSVTTTATGDRIIVATGAYTASTGTWSPPATMTARAQSGTASPVVALDDQGQQAAGATGTRAATYSQSSQLAGIVVALKPATAQPTATTYTYDTRGNRTGATPPTGSASTLGYDQDNRLTSFTQGTTSATYLYAGDGLRMTKTLNGTKTTFTWDQTVAVPALLYDGTENYIYGPDGALVEQIDNSGNQVWYHHDQIGSTRVLSDNTGAVVSTFTYDAYGNQTGHTGTLATPWGYVGGYTDAESTLIYLRNRYYDPVTAQFASQDPAVSVTLAPYSYVGDNPLNYADPTGLDKISCRVHPHLPTIDRSTNQVTATADVSCHAIPDQLQLTICIDGRNRTTEGWFEIQCQTFTNIDPATGENVDQVLRGKLTIPLSECGAVIRTRAYADWLDDTDRGETNDKMSGRVKVFHDRGHEPSPWDYLNPFHHYDE